MGLRSWKIVADRRSVAALDLADDRTTRDALTDLGSERGDDAVLVCVERLFHLHRFQYDDQLAGGNLLTVLDGDLDDRALHRAGQRVTAHTSGDLGPAGTSRRTLGRRARRTCAEACG